MDINVKYRALHKLASHISERTKKSGFYDYVAHNEDYEGVPTFTLFISNSDDGEQYASCKFSENEFAETFRDTYNRFATGFNNKYCDKLSMRNPWTEKKWMKLPILINDSWEKMFPEVYKEQTNKLLLLI